MLTYLPATEPLLPALKALNSDIFPIQYNDSFYASVLVNASFSVLAIDSESETETESEKESEQRLVGAICCRREPPPPPPSIPSIPSSTTFPHSQNTQNPQPTQTTPNDSLYIMTIGVLDTFRGKGIGSSLLTSLLEQARTALPPLDSVRLHVHVANTSALRFYRKHGFELVQTVYGYYRLNKGVEPPDAYYLMFDLRGRRDCDVVCIVCEGRCGCSLGRRVGGGGGGGGGGGALSNVKVRYETLLEVGGGNQSVSSVGVAAAATEYRNLDPFKQRLSRLPPRSSSATNSHSSKPWNPREECVKNENGTDQMEESDSARVRSWDYQKASIASRLQEHPPQQKPTIASRLQEYAPQQYHQYQQPYQQTYQQQYQQHYQQQLYNQQQRLYQQQSSHTRPPPPSPPTYAPPSASSYQMFREYVPPSEYNE